MLTRILNSIPFLREDWYKRIPLVQTVIDEWYQIQSFVSHLAICTMKFWAFVMVGIGWCIGLGCSSLIAYLIFYHFMIPQHHTAIPVHFDFAPTITATPASYASSTSLQPYTSPYAVVHLIGDKQWRYTDRSGSEGQRDEQQQGRYFANGHQYNAYLDLVFPDSTTNHDCGMLSVEMTAWSGDILLATSLQSFLPQYTSPLVRWMWSWVFALPLVTGMIQEKQSLTLQMFDQLVEQENSPISDFRIILKSPNANRFQLYTATLRLQVQLYGLRYLMYHWPISTASVIIGILFATQLFWSSVLLLVICFMFCTNGSQEDDDEYGSNDGESNAPVSDPSDIDPFIQSSPSSGTQPHFWQPEDEYQPDEENEDRGYAASVPYHGVEGQAPIRSHYTTNAPSSSVRGRTKVRNAAPTSITKSHLTEEMRDKLKSKYISSSSSSHVAPHIRPTSNPHSRVLRPAITIKAPVVLSTSQSHTEGVPTRINQSDRVPSFYSATQPHHPQRRVRIISPGSSPIASSANDSSFTIDSFHSHSVSSSVSSSLSSSTSSDFDPSTATSTASSSDVIDDDESDGVIAVDDDDTLTEPVEVDEVEIAAESIERVQLEEVGDGLRQRTLTNHLNSQPIQ